MVGFRFWYWDLITHERTSDQPRSTKHDDVYARANQIRAPASQLTKTSFGSEHCIVFQ